MKFIVRLNDISLHDERDCDWSFVSEQAATLIPMLGFNNFCVAVSIGNLFQHSVKWKLLLCVPWVLKEYVSVLVCVILEVLVAWARVGQIRIAIKQECWIRLNWCLSWLSLALLCRDVYYSQTPTWKQMFASLLSGLVAEWGGDHPISHGTMQQYCVGSNPGAERKKLGECHCNPVDFRSAMLKPVCQTILEQILVALVSSSPYC